MDADVAAAAAMQGLADAFILLGMPFDSPEAQQLNREIFETVYFAALEESCRLAQSEGRLWLALRHCHKEQKFFK